MIPHPASLTITIDEPCGHGGWEVSGLENKELQTDKTVSLDRDAKISVTLNRQEETEENTIDLSRVFFTMKKKKRLFAWVLVLCMLVGVCAPLVLAQFSGTPLTVSSLVTLNYGTNGIKAPDGSELDLNQLTSSYVLQNALNSMELSQPLTVSVLKNNIRIERILSENSRRQQEVASSMIADKNNGAYTQVQGVKLDYTSQFIVTLTNAFGDEDSRKKLYLKDDELQLLLDRILESYNGYMVKTYADMKLPDDKISVIDSETLDIRQELDQLRNAMNGLYSYCTEKNADIRAYRSWRTGLSLNDIAVMIDEVREMNIQYLYSYVYTNSIVEDGDDVLTDYRYQLRVAELRKDTIEQNIRDNDSILADYKNDSIFVSMQESDATKSTTVTTDYYNQLVMEQADNYRLKASNRESISDLEDKISQMTENADSGMLALAKEEMAGALAVSRQAYGILCDHMNEIMNTAFYTDYILYSASEGKAKSFLAAASRRMIIGAVLGAVIGCGIWFLAGLLPEFRYRGDSADGKEALEG